jgi:hypothetical protein
MWTFGSDGTISDYDTGAAAAPGANEWWGSSQPSTSDSGFDYGGAVLDIFKYGVGILAMRSQAEWEDKRRYETAKNGIALQGQAAAVSVGTATASSSMLPMIAIGAAALVVVVLLFKD